MAKAGLQPEAAPGPLWLLAELTYACPLQCPYCSNPVDFARIKNELDTDAWIRVLREARALGAAQLGFSGGEPLIRRDLEVLVEEGRRLGYYTNLITSGVGMDAERVRRLSGVGLDSNQLASSVVQWNWSFRDVCQCRTRKAGAFAPPIDPRAVNRRFISPWSDRCLA